MLVSLVIVSWTNCFVNWSQKQIWSSFNRVNSVTKFSKPSFVRLVLPNIWSAVNCINLPMDFQPTSVAWQTPIRNASKFFNFVNSWNPIVVTSGFSSIFKRFNLVDPDPFKIANKLLLFKWMSSISNSSRFDNVLTEKISSAVRYSLWLIVNFLRPVIAEIFFIVHGSVETHPTADKLVILLHLDMWYNAWLSSTGQYMNTRSCKLVAVEIFDNVSASFIFSQKLKETLFNWCNIFDANSALIPASETFSTNVIDKGSDTWLSFEHWSIYSNMSSSFEKHTSVVVISVRFAEYDLFDQVQKGNFQRTK